MRYCISVIRSGCIACLQLFQQSYELKLIAVVVVMFLIFLNKNVKWCAVLNLSSHKSYLLREWENVCNLQQEKMTYFWRKFYVNGRQLWSRKKKQETQIFLVIADARSKRCQFLYLYDSAFWYLLATFAFYDVCVSAYVCFKPTHSPTYICIRYIVVLG